MAARLPVVAIALALALPAVAADRPDLPGSADHPLFTRMPGFSITRYVAADFDGAKFRDGTRETTVEGRSWSIEYALQPGATPPSTITILKNFQNAARSVGGKVLHENPAETTVRVARGGAETWVRVAAWSGGRSYSLRIVEKGGMAQQVAANADALRAGLAASGHVEVPGIFFDTGKAALKAESEAALAEVAKLLQTEPALRLWVVGHTDSVGTARENEALSFARADAVMKALVSRGVDPGRLDPFGNGPYAPVAPNTTEEGRAKNRRVELVAR